MVACSSPLYIRKEEISYFALFRKNSIATRFTFVNCTEMKFADASRKNVAEVISRLSSNQNRAGFVSYLLENCSKYARLSKNDTSNNISNRVLAEEMKSAKTVKDVQAQEMIV